MFCPIETSANRHYYRDNRSIPDQITLPTQTHTPTPKDPVTDLLMNQWDMVGSEDDCSPVFQAKNHCSILFPVTPIERDQWQQLFPNDKFYLAQAVSLTSDYKLIPDAGGINQNWNIVALSGDQIVYAVDNFPDLLKANQIVVTDANHQLVIQALVLMTLPYYIQNEIQFSNYGTSTERIDTIGPFNYVITAWTQLHGLQIDYYLLFDGAQLKSIRGYVDKYETGQNYIPIQNNPGGRQLYSYLRLEHHY